jgi:hypothetical protein
MTLFHVGFCYNISPLLRFEFRHQRDLSIGKTFVVPAVID